MADTPPEVRAHVRLDRAVSQGCLPWFIIATAAGGGVGGVGVILSQYHLSTMLILFSQRPETFL